MPGQGPKRQVCLLDATTDETLGTPFDASQTPYVTAYVIGTGTTSSGVVTFEEADWSDTETPYAGTWSSIGTVNASDVTGGAQKASHFAAAAYRYIRPRITTAIGGGGSVTVVLVGVGTN